MISFISNREIYEQVIRGRVPLVEKRLWIATADIKDMYVDPPSRGAATEGKFLVPFLEVLSELVARGIEIRLIHAKEPGPNFREDFDRYPRLFRQMERVLCPRVHFKCILIDSMFAWFGSANLTGAGMGAKSLRKRNFENGVVTDDQSLIGPLEDQFDAVWRGDFCKECGRRDFCSDPIIS